MSAVPGQPTQTPSVRRTTGSNALTKPPGLRRHSTQPSRISATATGNRFATTTKS
jgi:hypothetical protein